MKNTLFASAQKTFSVIALLLLCTSVPVQATTYLVAYIDPPWPSSSIKLSALNNRGVVAGTYYYEGVGYSFIYDGENFTRLAYTASEDDSPAGFTNVISMNDNNVFTLTHEDQGMINNYLYTNGVYSPFVIPDAADATMHQITNQGHLAIQQSEFTFTPPYIAVHSYIYDGEFLQDISIENEFMTFVSGLNDSNMAAGSYLSYASTYNLFTFQDDQYVFFEFPNTKEPVQKISLNNWGTMCGNFYNGEDYEGFILDSDTGMLSVFTDTPYQINGINDTGQLVGSITDSGNSHGFLATPLYMDSELDGDSDGADLATLAQNMADQTADQGDLLNFARNFGQTHDSMHVFKAMDNDKDGDTDGRDIAEVVRGLANHLEDASSILNVAQNFGRTANIVISLPFKE